MKFNFSDFFTLHLVFFLLKPLQEQSLIMFNDLKKYRRSLKRLRTALRRILFENLVEEGAHDRLSLWKGRLKFSKKALPFKQNLYQYKNQPLAVFFYSLKRMLIPFSLFFYSLKRMLIPFSLFFYNLKRMLIPFFLFFYSFNSYSNTDTSPKPNTFEQLFPFLLIGLFFYFILIRPQQKKYKQHGDFLSKVKKGDEVLTSSGIYGRIEGLTDSFAILEVAENVRIRIAKSQIASYTMETAKEQQKNPSKREKLKS